MATARLIIATCASLLLGACAHVRGDLAQSSAPLAGMEVLQDPEPSEPLKPYAVPPPAAAPIGEEPASELPAQPATQCASGYVGRGVLYGIGATLKVVGTICIAGGPFTLILCGAAIAAYPEAAIGTVVGSMIVGALVGGAVGAAKCPSPPPRAAPPAEAPSSPPADPSPEPSPEPTPEPAAGPGVSSLPGGACPALG